MRFSSLLGVLILVGGCGRDGRDGADGRPGINGVDGSDNHIIATLYCHGLLSGTGFGFDYDAAQLSSGDVLVSAHIIGVDMQAGDTTFYAATQSGADTAIVAFLMDVLGTDNGGYWTVEVPRTAMTPTVTYFDADASGGSDSWTFLASACSLQTF